MASCRSRRFSQINFVGNKVIISVNLREVIFLDSLPAELGQPNKVSHILPTQMFKDLETSGS